MAVVQGSSRKWDTDSLVPETKIADVGEQISLENLLVRKVPTTSAPLILSRAFGADHMTSISHIYSRLTITLSYILTSRDSLALPASDTQLNTRNMGAYILCDFFLSYSAFSTGLVPVLRTVSGISSNPERDKRPTCQKTHLPKIHL